jgi:hypothetical protein
MTARRGPTASTFAPIDSNSLSGPSTNRKPLSTSHSRNGTGMSGEYTTARSSATGLMMDSPRNRAMPASLVRYPRPTATSRADVSSVLTAGLLKAGAWRFRPLGRPEASFRPEVHGIEVAGMISSIAHVAYHMGARQISKTTRGPGLSNSAIKTMRRRSARKARRPFRPQPNAAGGEPLRRYYRTYVS